MKNIFVLLFLTISVMVYAQNSNNHLWHRHNFQNKYQKELHNEVDHRENQKNFTKSKEFRKFHLSERSRDHFDQIYEYIVIIENNDKFTIYLFRILTL